MGGAGEGVAFALRRELGELPLVRWLCSQSPPVGTFALDK